MKHANDMPASLAHHNDGGFRNPWPGSAPHGFGGFIKWVATRSASEAAPSRTIDVRLPAMASSAIELPEKADRLTITWVGHSSFLIQCSGINILTDPIWSNRASPVSFAGPHRLVPPGVAFEQLPEIDITLLSHDHYDHLDDATVQKLVARFPCMKWLAPLRVGAFLRKRGASDVTELDWWEQRSSPGIAIGCTPAQHFSGRYPWNRNSSLWCGWTLQFDDGTRVFFAGDTGLHPEFAEISRRFGPFEMAILPIGAYEPRWFMNPVHMAPEDSVAAFQQLIGDDVQRCVMVGSHWGTFRLTDEPVMEPPRLTHEVWTRAGLPPDSLWILDHGETRVLGQVEPG